MKTILAGLQNDTQTTYANNGKTTLLGRITQKTINSQSVLGAPLSRFIDTFAIAGIGAQYTYYNPDTTCLFVCGPIGAATTVMLFTINPTTGEATYVGRIVCNLPNVAATTYTARGFAVYESGATATVLISATGSVAINSGIFMANKVPISAFTPGGTQIFAASGTDQVAMYQLQDSLLYGVRNPLTTSQGVILPQFSTNPANNTKVWQWNGTLAASQLFGWDLATPPTVAGLTAAGSVTSSSSVLPNTSPAAYFTMPSNAAGYNSTNADPVCITGVPPTGINAWTPGTLQTGTATGVYFLRDLQQQQNLTVTGVQSNYTFTTTATSSAILPGAQYTNNTRTFTAQIQVAAASTSVSMIGTGAPTTSGTLTLAANQFAFTASANIEPIGNGAQYTNNGQTFTFTRAFGTGTTSFVLNGTGAPSASGTLTRTSGTGPATITFSAFTTAVGPATIPFSLALTQDNRYVFGVTALAVAVAAGVQYTNNAQTFTLSAAAAAAAVSISTNGTGAPTGSGTLSIVANQFTFTVPATASQIAPGTVYSHNGQNYTVNLLFAAGVTSFTAVGTGAPILTGGTLTLVSGTGPASIVFTAAAGVSTPATIAFQSNTFANGILQGATYTYTVNTTAYTVTFPLGASLGATSIQGTVLTGNPAPVVFQQTGALIRATGTGPEVISFSAHTPGAWFFNLSSDGSVVSIPTSSVNTFDIRYAFGISTNQFHLKTAAMASTFALGTILNNQNTGYAKPVSAPAAPSLNGQDCIFMSTTTGLYMGLISDLQMQRFNFTITASTIGSGAVYMQNNQYFTASAGITGGTVLTCTGTGTPTASGVLTKVSGTGPDSVAFSGFTLSGNQWPSMNFLGINMLGTGVDIVAPTAIQSIYAGTGFPLDVDRAIINQSLSSFVSKPYQANNITDFWGGQNNFFFETKTDPVNFSMFNAAGTVSSRNGFFFIAQPTQVGQRGVIIHDISSDATYGLQGIISPVISFPPGTQLRFIDAIQQLANTSGPINFWVRSGATQSDPNFSTGTLPVGNPTVGGTVSNGWTYIASESEVGSYAIGPFYQFCLTFQTCTRAARLPAQVYDIALSVQLPGEASEKWAPSVDNSTQSGDSPMFVAWRLQQAYATSVPTLYVRGYDDAGNLVASFNTSANAASFEYSTNNGTSWVALGTIPNVALTTEVRVNVATPPATNRINWSISES